jgi:hypothetical protein
MRLNEPTVPVWVRVGFPVWDQARDQVWYRVLDQARDQVLDQVWFRVWNQVSH